MSRISRTRRRHHRVGDPRGRRQGQGAEGGGRGRHRLRRRRARLPDARAHRRGRRRRRAATRANHQLHARRRACPSCAPRSRHKTKRDSGVDVRGRAGARHQRRQARRLQHVPGAARPRRRGAVPAPYWTTYPEAIALAGGVPVVLPDHRGRPGSASRSSSSRRRARRARRRCCSCRRATRPARCTRRDEVEAIGRWARRARHLGGHRRDLRAPHLRRPRVHVDAGARARARRARASCSTASPRPTR